MIFWLLIFGGTLAYIYFIMRKPKLKGKPIPGPSGLPIVGNGLQLVGVAPHIQFSKWAEKYGDIYQVQLANKTQIVINSQKMLKEIFSDPNYTGRVPAYFLRIYEDTPFGLIHSDGEEWERHQRFMLRYLRDIGIGRSKFEPHILKEVEEVIQVFKRSKGKPIKNLKKILSMATLNSLSSVVLSVRSDYDDLEPMPSKLVEDFFKMIEEVTNKGMMLLFAPWLKWVMPKLSGYESSRKSMEAIRVYFEEMVKERKRTFKEDELNDYIDVHLAEMKKADPSSTFYGEVGDKQLVATLFDLMEAGGDTSGISLAFSIMYLCKWPEYQRKLMDEIERVTGNGRAVQLEDKLEMPFTLAFMDEVFRFASFTPMGFLHRAIQDQMFQDYFIPKDTWIMPNLYHIHHNKNVWEDPEVFKPKRFLISGKYKKDENVIPFNIGRRMCPGENFGRDNFFLFLTNILQKVQVSFDPNEKEPGLEPTPNMLLQPQPFSVIMKERVQ